MNLNQLEESHIKLDNMEEFKKIVQEVIEGESKFKDLGEWLDEEYIDCSNEIYKQFRAVILCVNETYNDNTKHFKHGFKKVKSINVYDVFYTEIGGNGNYIADTITIGYQGREEAEGIQNGTENKMMNTEGFGIYEKG